MRNGALIFAHRSLVDYIAPARVAAKLVKRHLDIPVCLVTDAEIADSTFDQIVTVDPPSTNNRRYHLVNGQRQLGPWFNESRADALDLTPWDNTLLIDADYFVFNDQLKMLFKSDIDFACYTQAQDLVTGQYVDQTTGYRSMSWATVCWFSRRSRPIFEMWKHVRNNWNYYNQLGDFNQPVFRNDHALTIALDTCAGHIMHKQFIPGSLTNVIPGTQLIDIQPDGKIIYSTGRGISRTKDVSLHVIDKTICTDPTWLSKLEAVHA